MEVKLNQLTNYQLAYCCNNEFETSRKRIDGKMKTLIIIPQDEISKVKGIRHNVCPYCEGELFEVFLTNGNFMKCKNCLKKY